MDFLPSTDAFTCYDWSDRSNLDSTRQRGAQKSSKLEVFNEIISVQY